MPSLELQTTVEKPNIMKIMSDMDSASGDAFDGSAEPVVYMSENRMPVIMEVNTAIVYIVFAALLLALIIIMPGVRRTKFASLVGIFTFLNMGAIIVLGLIGPHWLIGSMQVYESPYSSLSSETVTGKLDLNIGLTYANVSLSGRLIGYSRDESKGVQETIRSIYYNERFLWDEPDRMLADHAEALRKGLPYPILTVTEFLSQDIDGFNWTRQIRQAGQYCFFALYLALASWFLTALIMCAIPSYLPHMMQITGALMMSSVSIFTIMTKSPRSLGLFVGGNEIELVFGYTYVSTFVVGAAALLIGLLMLILQINNPHDQLTIMDSQGYINNQKALYQLNLAGRQLDLNKSLGCCFNDVDMAKMSYKKSDVVIPIDDIAGNFKKPELK